jgi:phosphate transport system permease protein
MAQSVANMTAYKSPADSRRARRRMTNQIMLGLTGAATLLALIPLVWILATVLERGLPAIVSPGFFTDVFIPVDMGGGGIAHALLGTVIIVGLATLIAVPLGILGAYYVAENPNTTFGLAVRFGTDVLSGLPSIVIGLFVYTIMVSGIGYSAIAGAIALSIMMLPVILRTTEEMIKLVPRSLNEAALGLGAPVWRSSLTVILPAALTGILTGVMLAVARVSGETAPLLFTAQGSNVASTDLSQPMAALPLTMYKYAIDPDPVRNTQAWGIALVIVVFVLVLNVSARAILNRRLKK